MLPEIDPSQEISTITMFLASIFRKEQKSTALIASSGGIDSSVTLALTVKALGAENVHVLFLPHKELNSQGLKHGKLLADFLAIPENNRETITIDEPVRVFKELLTIRNDQIRLGNTMARSRMIALYDRAKKQNALVVGTENRSEYLLGYFTRFGDEASDIEPIRHLYKTHVYTIAEHLQLPETIRTQLPSAGLWESQTDEEELGFTYQEADQVLFLYFDNHQDSKHIIAKGHKKAEKIIAWAKKNAYKHHVPYTLDVEENEKTHR